MTRRYHSELRTQRARDRREAILDAARAEFTDRGIDRVTIAEIAARADVGVSTVYAAFGSKEGLLYELMRAAMFGPRYEAARGQLDEAGDPVDAIARTAGVARAVYQGEHADLGALRGLSAFAPSLRELEERFEALRYEMQRERIERLHAAGRLAPALTVEDGRRILWALTGRELYRSLVITAGWSPDRYEAWLGRALVAQLVGQ